MQILFQIQNRIKGETKASITEADIPMNENKSIANVKKIFILFSKVYEALDGKLEVRWRGVKENSLLLIQRCSRVLHSAQSGYR